MVKQIKNLKLSKNKKMALSRNLPKPSEVETNLTSIITNYVFPSNARKYKIISFEKYLLNTQKHDMKMNQINQSSNIFKKHRDSIGRDISEQRLADEWRTYLQCDEYPETHTQSKIREYLYRIDLLENDLFAKTDSWILSIDQRSFLNQDLDAKFQTKNNLKQFKLDYCNKYNNIIGKLLKVRIFPFYAGSYLKLN
ncbi:uncharacterized protein LOC129606679 [Condylostylus longicornis]|uniref:uncharacterized protein LOC129606679 n=1 Tax=Condylostylus longicornis TaxID=2530218 RepID=UPI00244DDCC8|nr:uncharacterized protein LOC129606679 [Condylostylus longicornis]